MFSFQNSKKNLKYIIRRSMYIHGINSGKTQRQMVKKIGKEEDGKYVS